MEQVGQVIGECQYLQMLIVHHWCSLVERVGKLSWPTKWCQTFWRKEPSKTTSQDNYIPNTNQLGVAALNLGVKTLNQLGVAGDWELCHTSLANFTQAAEDMVECKEVSTNIFEAIFLLCISLWQNLVSELPRSWHKTSSNPVWQLWILWIQWILVKFCDTLQTQGWSERWAGTRWTTCWGWAGSTCSPSTSRRPSSSVLQNGTTLGQGQLASHHHILCINQTESKNNSH